MIRNGLRTAPWQALRWAWRALPVSEQARLKVAPYFDRWLPAVAVRIRHGTPKPPAWLYPRPAKEIAAGDFILSGFLADLTGIGRAGRMSLGALEASQVKVIAHDLRRPAPPEVSGSSGGIWLGHCNPPEAVAFLMQSDLAKDRYRIGYWAWELPELPEDWVPAIALFHELWAPSQFVADAIEKARGEADILIRVVPHPLPEMTAAYRDRSRFGIDEDVFAFLCMYDVRSTAARKNPMGAVKAFQMAFSPDDRGVCLVVKVNSTDPDPDCLDPLHQQIQGWSNIQVIVESLSDADSDNLIASADVFVSLHRSEGFGLSIAQAMTLGRAVIATGWSGNVDFTEGGIISVPYDLTPAADPSGRYNLPGQVWAEPDLSAAGKAMAALASDRDLTTALGRNGYDLVRQKLPRKFEIGHLKPWLEHGVNTHLHLVSNPSPTPLV